MACRSFHCRNPRQLITKNTTNTGNLRRIKARRSGGMERNPVHRHISTIPLQGPVCRTNKKLLKHARLGIGSHEMPRLVGTAAPSPFHKWHNATHRGVAGGFQNHAGGTFRRQHTRAPRTQGTALGILRHAATTIHGGFQSRRNRSIRSHGQHRIEHPRGNQ